MLIVFEALGLKPWRALAGAGPTGTPRPRSSTRASRSIPRPVARSRTCGSSPRKLLLRLQLAIVLLDEAPDVVAHVQEPCPLLFVEGDREPPQPVHGDAALLAHLDRDALSAPVL